MTIKLSCLTYKSMETDNDAENIHGFVFLPEIVRTNKLMLLRRIVNHPFLAIERPSESMKTSSCESNEENGSDDEVDALLQASGKMCLLDKLLRKLVDDGHKVMRFRHI